MANILITGGAGYLGNVVTNLALQGGHKVKVVDALWFNTCIPLVHINNPGYEFIKGDIRDGALIDSLLEGVDFVVHAAAVVGEPACKKFPKLTQEINHDASLQLIHKAARKALRGFIFISTCSNYGIAEGVATEESELKPLSLYARTKVDVERALMGDAGGLEWAICRLSTLYGASPRMRFDLTVNDFTMNAFTKKYLDIFLPYTYRSYIHVYDAARVILSMIERFGEASNNVFNVGFSGENYQKIQIAETVQRHIPEVRVDLVDRGEDVRDYRVDFSKLERCLGLSKTYIPEDGVREIKELLEAGLIEDPTDKRYYNTDPNIGG